ncbi:MAG TPA: DNA-processing protein DprA [Thermoanaerobaculia bacterium]|nr:DNA-processing protein DprA [Thermoanaerobaculia bacterium]
MNAEDRDLLIAWSCIPFLSPNRTRLLQEYFDPVSAACSASSGVLSGLLSVQPEQADLVKNPLLNEELRRLVFACRDSTIVLGDPDYPPLLREIIDPPLALHALGDRSLLQRMAVAVVGSRRASPYGVNAAQHLTRQLVSAGLVIVSGLARGIDAAAHDAALSASGKTIAVLGTGIDVVYPRSNAKLFRAIESDGLIVSEFRPGTPPLAENFPMRNRVISGLCAGTIIVEATSRSGSLITARMAAEQGREVFAVPGSIFSKGTEGTHRLIQYGAKLVHDADDVFDELPGDFKRTAESAAQPDSPLREVLSALTKEEGTHIDALASRLSRPSGAIAESLLQLELGGWIRALPGSRYVRVK